MTSIYTEHVPEELRTNPDRSRNGAIFAWSMFGGVVAAILVICLGTGLAEYMSK